jgi:large subunit ribosomal protein L4
MPSIAVLNQVGEKVKEINLSEKVFAVEPNMQVVFEVVNAKRASLRQGTHDTKNRTEVSGGGRKPWRQKGTGHARQGSIRAPQWRGGGIVFGPTPRSYAVRVNKKVVKAAVRNLLTDRFNSNNLIVVDKIELADFKTKSFIAVLNAIKADAKKVIVITKEDNPTLSLASRNIPNVYVQTKDHLSVLDMINGDMYVMTLDAVEAYEEDLK